MNLSNRSSSNGRRPCRQRTPPKGKLPPIEVAKAFAFDVVIRAMGKQMGQSAYVLLGAEKGELVANQLLLQGGGRQSRQCVFQNITRCKQPG